VNLSEGEKRDIEVRGLKIVLSKVAAWRKLHGAASPELMTDFAKLRKREQNLLNSRS
jgi:hypothetical protein